MSSEIRFSARVRDLKPGTVGAALVVAVVVLVLVVVTGDAADALCVVGVNCVRRHSCLALTRDHGHGRLTRSRPPAARRVLAGVVRMLPADDRARYDEEFGAELDSLAEAGLSRRAQLGYALRQAGRVWPLRAALRAGPGSGTLAVIAARKTIVAGMLGVGGVAAVLSPMPLLVLGGVALLVLTPVAVVVLTATLSGNPIRQANATTVLDRLIAAVTWNRLGVRPAVRAVPRARTPETDRGATAVRRPRSDP